MESQYFVRSFLTLLLAAALLLVFPVVRQHVPGLREATRSYDFFSRFVRVPGDTLAGIPVDSTRAPADSAGTAFIPKYDGAVFLQPFLDALRGGREQVRIAHYGDSSIEGDMITGAVRDSLQRRFGGSGIGFVPLVNPIAGFRRTIRHSFSGDWRHVYLGKANDEGLPRGPTGEYVSAWQPPDSLGADSLAVADTLPADPAAGGHWVFFGNTRLFPGVATFPTARLFYGAARADSSGLAPGPAAVSVSAGSQRGRFPLNEGGLLNEQILSTLSVRRLRLDFDTPPTLPLYGVSLESPEGVIVDNFPSRGNTGGALLSIGGDMLAAFQARVDYDLIMLQFGLNALNPDMIDYAWYTEEMVRVIRHFREAMPDAAILVLGPSDRAIRRDGRMQTDPSVPRITEALRAAAEQSQAAFFSFYEAMGGAGAMARWVDEYQPRLANLDYTHFNFAGADKAARLLLDFLLAEAVEGGERRAEGRSDKTSMR